jgi:hypothetical protein
MTLPQTRFFGAFFGHPWPSGICDEGTQVATPVGERCAMCDELVEEGHQGSFIGTENGLAPVHKECSLRSVMGGIGHLTDHAHWCGEMHDPDGGHSYRHSALLVWQWVAQHGFPLGDRVRRGFRVVNDVPGPS